MKLKFNEVLHRTISLKKNSPAGFNNLIEQFSDMALGGTGGIYFLSYSQTTVREQYYKDWDDENFVKLLNDLKKYTDDKK